MLFDIDDPAYFPRLQAMMKTCFITLAPSIMIEFFFITEACKKQYFGFLLGKLFMTSFKYKLEPTCVKPKANLPKGKTLQLIFMKLKVTKKKMFHNFDTKLRLSLCKTK
jgi:hypothetical protein